jgi:hypothetical protein
LWFIALLFQENKSFGANCHLHSSSDVREAVSGTIYFLWHSGTQAAHGQRDADSGTDKEGNGKENGSKVMLRQHANCRLVTTPRKDQKSF